MKWYFVSYNKYKYEELAPLCSSVGIDLVHLPHNTREKQLADFQEIVSDKAIEAFNILRSKVLVDHSGLEMDCLKGLPGGLTQLFWDRLEDRLVTIASGLKDTRATAVTALGYCNGRKVWTEIGRLEGDLAPSSGARAFQWDSIFRPGGGAISYASMTIDEKNKISQRRVALMKLIERLQKDQELS